MSNEQGTYSVFGVNSSTLIPFADFYDNMHFGGDSNTYKELIYTSSIKNTLNLTIEVLTNESKTSRLALRNDRKKLRGEQIEIPRPQNAWIIYRRDKYVSPEFVGIKPCNASKTIGEKWKAESNEVLEYFVALSMLALENHHNKYGDYKYKPKSKASKKFKIRQRQQPKRNTSPETEKTKLNQDLPQLVVNPPSPTKEYPTPLSSIQHSPVTDFSEQENENSYLMTPASSNHQSPVTSQYGSSDILTPESLNQQTPQYGSSDILTPESLNQQTPQCGSSDILTPESLNQQTPITSEEFLSFMNSDPISMYPQLSEITPTTYNNNSLAFSEYVLKFLYDANMLALQSSTDVDILATPAPDMTSNDMTFVDIAPNNTDISATPAPDMTFDDMTFGVDIAPNNTDIPATLETLPKFIFNSTTNMNDQIKDFDLYSDNEESEELIAEPMTTSMENQIIQELFEYDSHDLFSINATPSVDQFDYYDNNNGSSF